MVTGVSAVSFLGIRTAFLGDNDGDLRVIETEFLAESSGRAYQISAFRIACNSSGNHFSLFWRVGNSQEPELFRRRFLQ